METMTTFRTDDFRIRYHAKYRTFTAYASDLGRDETGGPTIRLMNPKTGVTVTFTFTKLERDPEGDISAYLYRSEKYNIELTIIND